MKLLLILCASVGLTVGSDFSQSEWASLRNEINGYISYYDHIFHPHTHTSLSTGLPKFKEWENTLNESIQALTDTLDSEGLIQECGKYILRLSDVENYLNAVNNCFHKIHEDISPSALREESDSSKHFLADLRFLKSFSDDCAKEGNEAVEKICFGLVQPRLEESKRRYSQQEHLLAAEMSRVVHYFSHSEELYCGQTKLIDLLQVRELRNTMENMVDCLMENIIFYAIQNSQAIQKKREIQDSLDKLTRRLSGISVQNVLLHL